MERTSKDLFDEMFLLVLRQLLDQMPRRVDLNPVSIAKEMGVSVTATRERIGGSYVPREEKEGFGYLPGDRNFYYFYTDTLIWMDREGFITRECLDGVPGRSSTPGRRACLTSKGLAALNQDMPKEQIRIIDKLRSISGESAGETRRAVISEVAGAIIGGFARSMAG